MQERLAWEDVPNRTDPRVRNELQIR